MSFLENVEYDLDDLESTATSQMHPSQDLHAPLLPPDQDDATAAPGTIPTTTTKTETPEAGTSTPTGTDTAIPTSPCTRGLHARARDFNTSEVIEDTDARPRYEEGGSTSSTARIALHVNLDEMMSPHISDGIHSGQYFIYD